MAEAASLDKLIADPFGLRVHYDDKVVKNLGGSILQSGVVTPLLVRPQGDKYEIIDGNYRYKALEHIGWKKPVPVNVRELTGQQALIEAVIANWHRKNFRTQDKASAIKKLKTAGLSNEDIAIKLELKNPKSIYHYLSYEEEVSDKTKGILSHASVTTRHIKALTKLKEHPDKQHELAELIVTKPLTGPQALTWAKNIVSPKETPPKPWECELCENKFTEELKTKVTLCPACAAEFETWKNERIKHD